DDCGDIVTIESKCLSRRYTAIGRWLGRSEDDLMFTIAAPICKDAQAHFLRYGIQICEVFRESKVCGYFNATLLPYCRENLLRLNEVILVVVADPTSGEAVSVGRR